MRNGRHGQRWTVGAENLCHQAIFVDDAVGAENLVHGSDQQSCSLCRLALMIAGHVPAIRLSPDHAGGLVVRADNLVHVMRPAGIR